MVRDWYAVDVVDHSTGPSIDDHRQMLPHAEFIEREHGGAGQYLEFTILGAKHRQTQNSIVAD